MGIKTADRTFELIELFAREQTPLTLSSIADKTAIPVSSAHALIRSLQQAGYLYEVSRHDGYYLTKRLERMTALIAAGVSLLDRIHPFLSRLSEEIAETVLVAKRQGDAVTYLDVVESRQSVRFSPLVGETKALHCSASGKAVLGTLTEPELDRTLQRLVLDPRTPQTITDPQRLRSEIVEHRALGWYQVVGENIADLMAIASSVRIGDECYVVTAGGPIQRFRPLTRQHADRLLQTCRRIQTALA